MPQKEKLLSQKRIFVGFNSAGAAGIYAYTRVLKRRGYQIDFYGIGKKSFNMPVDFLLDFGGNRVFSFFKRLFFFFKILSKYDIWHLNYLESFFFYPLNLFLLKIFGKKIVLTVRGSEVRKGTDFISEDLLSRGYWPRYYLDDNLSRYARYSQRIRKSIFLYYADSVILTGPFLASAVPDYDKIIPYARAIKKIKISRKKSKKIKVLHVPSEPIVKGTWIVQKAFEKLAKKYKNVEFKILSKIPREELLKEIESSDIVVDQLLVGWYGGQAVEAMAMGKIVMAYIHPPYLALVNFGSQIPIINTNAWTFQEDLERTIQNFRILSKDLAVKSYTFVKKNHDSARIAQEYLEIYRQLL